MQVRVGPDGNGHARMGILRRHSECQERVLVVLLVVVVVVVMMKMKIKMNITCN